MEIWIEVEGVVMGCDHIILFMNYKVECYKIEFGNLQRNWLERGGVG